MSPFEIQFFGDRISRSMTLAGPLLLTLRPAAVRPQSRAGHLVVLPGIGAVAPNQLVAYKTDGGQVLWRCGTGGTGAAPDGFFLAAPVASRNGLVAPVWKQQAIWLISLDSATGKVGWRTQICLHPDGGRRGSSAVGVAVEGCTAYVATGAGAVAAVDTRLGSIQWLTTYQRGKGITDRHGRVHRQGIILNGCDEDVVIPYGSSLVVVASDCDQIFSLDRRSGAMLWSTGRSAGNGAGAASYCLGVLGEHLYVAGNQVVRCYKMTGGRAIWEHPVSNSLGRGALTGQTIYIPDGQTIVRLDASPKQMTGDQRVCTVIKPAVESDEPMGNLYSDGRHLLIMGMARVAMFGAPADQAALLSKREGP